MVLPALSLSQAELARAAPIIAHVGSDMGPKSKESELRGGTLKMLDEVCRGAGIRPVVVSNKADLEREFINSQSEGVHVIDNGQHFARSYGMFNGISNRLW